MTDPFFFFTFLKTLLTYSNNNTPFEWQGSKREIFVYKTKNRKNVEKQEFSFFFFLVSENVY